MPEYAGYLVSTFITLVFITSAGLVTNATQIPATKELTK